MATTLDLAVRLKDNASSNFNKISGTIDKFNDKLDEAKAKVDKFGDGMAGIGTKLSGFVTAPILGLGAAMLKAAADQEQLDVAFTTMLGSADKAKKLMEELKTFSATTPFEMPEVVNAGRQLLAYGIEADNVEQTLRRLGDVASGTGSNIGDLAYLYGTAKAQGRLFATDVNQFAGRGIPIFEALAKTMGIAQSEVKNLVSEGKVGFEEMEAAFAYMTAEGSQFGGMMEEQSKTLGGLFSTFKDNITIGLTEVGLKLVDTFDLRTKAADALVFVEEFRKAILGFIDNNPELVRTGAIFAGIAAALGPLLILLAGAVKVFGMMLPAVKALGAAFGLLTSPLALVVAGIAALFYFDVGGLATKFGSLSEKVGLVASNLHEIPGIASDAWEALKWVWEGDGDNIDWWNDITDGLVRMGLISQEVGDKVAEKLWYAGSAASDLKDAVSWIWAGKADNIDWWNDVTNGLVEIGVVSQETGDKLAENLFNAGVTIGGLKEKVTTLASSISSITFDDVKTKFEEIKNSISETPIVGPIFDGLKESLSGLSDISFEGIIEKITNFGTRLKETFDVINEQRGDLNWLAFGIGLVSMALENLSGVSLTEIGEGISGLGEKFKNGAESVGDFVSKVVSLSTDTATNIQTFLEKVANIDAVQTTFENISSAIGTVISDFQNLFTNENFKTELLDNLKTSFENLIPVITLVAGVIGGVLVFALNIVSGLLTGMPELIEATFGQVGATLELVSTILGETASAVLAIIQGDWSSAWNSAKNIYFGFYNYFKSTADNIKTAIAGIVESVGTAILNVKELFGMDTTSDFSGLTSLVEGIKNFELPTFKLPDFSEIELPKFEIPDLSTLVMPEFKIPNFGLFEMPTFKLPDFSNIKYPEFEWPAIKTSLFEGWPAIATALFAGWPVIATSLFAGWPVIATSLFAGWPSISTSLFEGWPSIPKPTWRFPSIPKPDWVGTLENLWGSRPWWLGGGGDSNDDSTETGANKNGKQNAMGTSYYSGGPTSISERGTETVVLPRGTRIYNAAETSSLRAASATPNGGVTLNFYGPVDSTSRVDEIVNRVINEISRRA